MNLIAVSGIQLLFLSLGLILILTLLYVIFHNRNETNQQIKILPQILLYVFSLAPLGFFIGLYIELRKKKVDGILRYKYSEQSRLNATILMFISLVSTILKIHNITIN